MKLRIALIALIFVGLFIGAASAQTFIINASGTQARSIGRAVDNSTYPDVVNGIGTYADAPGSIIVQTQSANNLTPNSFGFVGIGEIFFNTSGLPDNVTVESVKVSFKASSKATLLGSPEYVITGMVPLSNGIISVADYQNISRVPYSNTNITSASISTTNWNNWTLNAAAIANVSRTGYTNIAVAQNWTMDRSFGGTWQPYKNFSRVIFSTSTGEEPIIEIAYNYTVINYYAFGDSITDGLHGSGMAANGSDVYIMQMQRTYAPLLISDHNMDGSGQTSASGVAGISSHFNTSIRNFTIFWGDNDWVVNISPLQTAQNLEYMYNYVGSYGSRPLIMVRTLENNTAGRDNATANITIIQNYLDSKNITYMRAYDVLDNVPYNNHIDAFNGTFMSDGIHPDYTGHTKLGDLLWVYLQNTTLTPIANYTVNDTYGVKPLVVAFNDTSVNLTPFYPVTSWYWQFGDGTTSTAQNNTYTYTIAGNYTANLTATNAMGSNLSTSTVITVLDSAPPSLLSDFSASNTNPALLESVAFTDLSTGTPTTWNWSFGDGTNSTSQNPSHAYSSTGLKTVFLNVSNATGSFSQTTKVNYINVTTNGTASINTQDIVMAGAYNLVITVTDAATGLVTPGVTVTDMNNQTATTDAIGVATLTEPYSTVAGTLVATGYVSRSWSIVVDNDTAVTYQMTPATAAPVQNTWYTPHQVRFAVVDNRDNKLVGVSVNATAIAATFPQDSTADWLTQMYGINPDAANDMLNNTLIMHGTTGGDGSTAFTMLSSIGYTMQVFNPSNGVIHTTSVYPIDSLYTIRIAGTTINNTFTDMGMNTSLFVTEPNTTHVTMNLRYQDNSSKTTLLDFFVVAQINNTIINHQVFTGFGRSPVLANYTVRNTKPNAYSWYYNAVREP